MLAGTTSGDFFCDPKFPADHDVVLLSMIMHDWSEAENRAILRKCFAALPAGGEQPQQAAPYFEFGQPDDENSIPCVRRQLAYFDLLLA